MSDELMTSLEVKLSDSLTTSLEVKLDVIKEYIDSANDTECALWTCVLTFKPNLPPSLRWGIVPSIRITDIDTKSNSVTNDTLEATMSNKTSTTFLNFTYKDNSVIITGSGNFNLIRTGSLLPPAIPSFAVKAKCQDTEYVYIFKEIDTTSIESIMQSTIQLAYPTFIHV